MNLCSSRRDFLFGTSSLAPAAFANPKARPYDYRIWVDKETPEGIKWSKVHLVAQPEASLSRTRAIASGPVRLVIGNELPPGPGRLRVKVIARNSYGAETDRLESPWL